MPKKSPKFILNLDLLKSQGTPQQLFTKFLGWALSAGRYLIIFVEIIVLAAFLTRFKFDAELSDTKEAIENQIPYIDSLAPDEVKIRRLQFQIATIKEKKKQLLDFSQVFEAISNQVPAGITLTNIGIEQSLGGLNVRLSGKATNDLELASFVAGLKGDSKFSGISLKSVALEGGFISFTITGPINLSGVAGNNL